MLRLLVFENLDQWRSGAACMCNSRSNLGLSPRQSSHSVTKIPMDLGWNYPPNAIEQPRPPPSPPLLIASLHIRAISPTPFSSRPVNEAPKTIATITRFPRRCRPPPRRLATSTTLGHSLPSPAPVKVTAGCHLLLSPLLPWIV